MMTSIDETAHTMFSMGRMNPLSLVQIIREVKSIVDLFKNRSAVNTEPVGSPFNFTGQHTDIAAVSETGVLPANAIESIPDNELRKNIFDTFSDAVSDRYLDFNTKTRAFTLTEKGRIHINSEGFIRQFETDQLRQISKDRAQVMLNGNASDLNIFRYTDSVNLSRLSQSDNAAYKRVIDYFSECQRYGFVDIAPDGTITPTEKCLFFLDRTLQTDFEINGLNSDNIRSIAAQLNDNAANSGLAESYEQSSKLIRGNQKTDIKIKRRRFTMTKSQRLAEEKKQLVKVGESIMKDTEEFLWLLKEGLSLPEDSKGHELSLKMLRESGIELSTANSNASSFEDLLIFSDQEKAEQFYSDIAEKKQMKLREQIRKQSAEDVGKLWGYVKEAQRENDKDNTVGIHDSKMKMNNDNISGNSIDYPKASGSIATGQQAAAESAHSINDAASKKAVDIAAKKATAKTAAETTAKTVSTTASGAASMGIGAAVLVIIDLNVKGANALTLFDTKSNRLLLSRNN